VLCSRKQPLTKALLSRTARAIGRILLEMAQKHPRFKIQILYLAHQWLTLAIIEDLIATCPEEAERANFTLH
jgi:hypothetical protein